MAAKSQVLPKKYILNFKGRNSLSTKYNKIKSNEKINVKKRYDFLHFCKTD